MPVAYGAFTGNGENAPWLGSRTAELYYARLLDPMIDHDINLALRSGGGWQAQAALAGLNSGFREDDPFLDEVNHVMWFSSNADSAGNQLPEHHVVEQHAISELMFDVMTRRAHDELGTRAADSMEPALAPDGTIYFTLDGVNISRAHPKSGDPTTFDNPVTLSYSPPAAIESPSISDDRVTIFFTYHEPASSRLRVHYGHVEGDAIVDLGEPGNFQTDSTGDYFDPAVSSLFDTLSFAYLPQGGTIHPYFVTNGCPP